MKADKPCVRGREAVAYSLGELPTPDREVFEKHLAGCRACAQAVASFQGVIETLRSDLDAEVSPALAARMVARIKTSEAAFPPRRWRLPLQIAALFLVLLGLGLLWRAAVRRDTAPDFATVRRNALEWLIRAQGADGGWSAGEGAVREKYAVGVSALALMALIQDGAGAEESARSQAIRRGVEYLIRTQNEEGLFGAVFSGATYNQGLATLALIEACSLKSNATWHASAETAIAYLMSIQDQTGGWTYLGSAPGSANTSATIWPLLALIRADEQEFPGLRAVIGRGLAWMKTTVNETGEMGYRRPNQTLYGPDTLTAAGTACFLRGRHTAATDLPVNVMLAAVRQVSQGGDRSVDFYRAFFTSAALALAGDAESARMHALLRKWLASLQTRSGRWDATDRWGRTGGPVYATALAALALAGK